jgi:hemoglobin/transferrin/lactoferrin receptor protein
MMEWHGDNWDNFLTLGWQTSHQTRVADAVLNDGTPLPITFHPEGSDFKTGLFAQNEFTFDDRLTLIPGVRLDYRRLTPDDAIPDATDVDDVAISPKIATLYKLNDAVSVFGSVAHTERFPTIDETFSTTSNSGPFQPSLDLRKERSNNYEAGFALSGFDLFQPGDSGQVKLTGFYNDVSDLIALRAPYDPTMTGYRNINKAEIYGFEIESAYEADYVFASAAYSHLIGKDKTTGAYLTTIAPHELSLTLGGKIPDHGLRFGWKARFVANPQDHARRLPNAPSAFVTPRYAVAFDVHDLFVTWKPQEGPLAGWEGQFGVDNIFNRQYKEFLMNDSAKGRTFKISLSKQLGW